MIGKVTLLYIFVVAFLVGGCKTSLDEGFAVAVTVKVDPSVTAPALDAVTRMHVSVVGAETFDYDYDVDSELRARQGKFLYRPGAKMGALTFRVTLRNAGGQTLGYGESSAVTLVSGKTVQTTVVCAAPPAGNDMAQDLAMPRDLTGSDLPVVAEDLAVEDLATSDDLPAPTDDLIVPGPDFTIPTDFTGITLDLTVRDLFNPDLTPQDLKPIQDLTVIQDLIVPPDLVPPLCVVPPAKPRLIGPISTSRVSSRQPNVKWAAAAGAATYTVNFCDLPNCSSIASTRTGLTTLTTTPSAALTRGARWWRVTAVNGCGSTTSDIWELFVPGTSKTANTSMLGRGFMDFNLDGKMDLAASTNGSNSTNVYLNNGATIPNIVNKTIGEDPVGNVGDINGDGYGDLFVGNTIHLGSSTGLNTTLGTLTNPQGMLIAAGVGDVDGDGYGDFVVASGYTGTAGATLYFGGPTAPFSSVALPSGEGWADGAGDFDNDGFADIVTGNHNSSTAYVYFGAANARTVAMVKATIATPSGETNQFGGGVTGACDVDGNGIADIIINTAFHRSSYVYFGGTRTPAGGIKLTVSTDASANVESPRVQCAGDVNGDGIDDLIAGDTSVGAVSGRFLIFHGSSSAGTFNTTADSTVDGSDNASFGTSRYGNAVMGLGDVNSDGFDDVIVASVQCSGPAAYIYRGSNVGLVESSPLATLTGIGGCNSYYFAQLARPRRVSRQ